MEYSLAEDKNPLIVFYVKENLGCYWGAHITCPVPLTFQTLRAGSDLGQVLAAFHMVLQCSVSLQPPAPGGEENVDQP